MCRRNRPLQERRPGRIAIREERREPVDEEIARVERPRAARGVARRAGDRKHAHAEPGGIARRQHRLEIRLARESDVQRLESSGSLDEHGRGRAVRACGFPLEQAAETVSDPTVALRERPLLRRRQQCSRILVQAGKPLPLRRGERSLRAQHGVRRQLGGPLEEGRRRGGTAPCPRTVRRALELGGDVLVECKRCVRTMPRAPIRVGLRIGRVRERGVYGAPVLGMRGLIERRPQERVTKRDPLADRNQVGRLGRRRRVRRQP
jgi:hypothetical protein